MYIATYFYHLLQILSTVKPMNLSLEEERDFQAAEKCHICEKPFSDVIDLKVGDHCHLTGQYRSAAHNSCNRYYRNSFNIPVIKYVEGTRVRLTFIDSFRFMASFLQTLATNFENDKKHILKRHFQSIDDFKLLTEKQVFPYGHVTNESKLEERK